MIRVHRAAVHCTIVCLAAVVAACTRHYVSTDYGPQAYYQTSYPLRDTSRELEQIFRSVKRLQITGYYDTYRFAVEDSVTDAELRSRAVLQRARERFTFEHAKAGTATAISSTGGTLRLLTNAHVTRMPDTVVAYFESPAAARTDARYVESVAILRNRVNVILGVPGASQFRIVASDSAADLALIGVDVDAAQVQQEVPLLRVRPGDPARLAWGSFVYVLGYPRGYMMVTRAIVSDPGRGSDHAFMLDGLFNRGISGGLILAVRGDTGELELVGLATATSAQTELLLVPEQRVIDEHGVLMPYDGVLFTDRVRRIDYGITFPVTTTAIDRFLRAAGYPLSRPPPRTPSG